jgi:hypothetical protein
MHVYACMHAFTHSFTQTVFDNLFFIITTQTYPAFLLNEDMKTNRIVCLLLLVNGGYSRHKKDKKRLEIRNTCHRESNVVRLYHFSNRINHCFLFVCIARVYNR